MVAPSPSAFGATKGENPDSNPSNPSTGVEDFEKSTSNWISIYVIHKEERPVIQVPGKIPNGCGLPVGRAKRTDKKGSSSGTQPSCLWKGVAGFPSKNHPTTVPAYTTPVHGEASPLQISRKPRLSWEPSEVPSDFIDLTKK